MLTLSYLVTVHNEDRTLENLLSRLESFACGSDKILVLDDFSDNPKTQNILHSVDTSKFTVIQHKLDDNYGAHKNYGNSLCKGDWIFQIDGDELPSIDLVVNIKDIIEANQEIELLFVPRINDFRGVTEQEAKKWNWKLTNSPSCENRPIVNWPDYQSRVYKNAPDRIKWDRRLHEKIEGHTKFGCIPSDENLALYHDKTIEKQIETNLRYNKTFTQEENQGHHVFDKKK